MVHTVPSDSLQTERPSETLDAFKKFTKDKENREKAEIPEEARKLAVELAGVEGFSKESFSLDPLVQARTLCCLCEFRGGMEDCCATVEMLEHSLKIYEKHFGEDHRVVAMTLNDLGCAYSKLGDHHKQGALSATTTSREHFQVAKTLVNLGPAYGAMGDHNKEKDLLGRALEIFEEHYGEAQFEVAGALSNLGNACGALGDHHKEKYLIERALEIKEQHYGEDHFEVAITLYNLARAHGALGDRRNEAQMLTKVLPIFERHFGMGHKYCGLVKRALIDAPIVTETDQQNPKACVCCFIFPSSLWQ